MTLISIPGYRAIEQLYSGSRTLVYRGFSESDNQPVVIKLLKSEYPTFSELVQFRNQYTIAKNIENSGIVKHLSLEVYRNGFALVMEDFGGISLAEYITNETWNLKEKITNSLDFFLQIALKICSCLESIYNNKVIHKDIKPQNIIINPKTQEVKIIDFSISSLLPRENPEIKNPNILEGTLAYMSPEQTGRMNRGIDYRTDFYSLGVTFYELLTGQLPFQSNEPMELVHSHIARQPIHPIALNPAIPQVLNDIVLKLMAKTAEARYQTVGGIKHDLEKCLKEYSERGTIQLFELGSRDIPERFVIPEKLYGRETEVLALLAAFHRVACPQENSAAADLEVSPSSSREPQKLPPRATTEIMLVAGFSGIGKTAVVNEVHKPIVQQRGYFIKGKFDQFRRDIPFSAWVQALQSFLQQLLTESVTQVQQWQAQILSALGDKAQVIIDVIPELELLIGKQPAVQELEPNPAQNCFNLLFQKFIRVFATKNHPLVIFLDDLQWADSASLKLMQLLLGESEGQHLLLIGAYRDNEVSSVHPLMLTLSEIRNLPNRSIDRPAPIINQITLAPLSKIDLNRLVADALSCPPSRSISLTELIFQKTKGNPFFSNQFLRKLHEDKLIYFDFTPLDGGERRGWQCDITKIRELAVSDDVVEFMANQLQKLPLNTQNILKIAACIGSQFDLETLAVVCEKSPIDTAADLWKALQEGLILPQSEVYKFFAGDGESAPLAVADCQLPSYKFLHDRVQQASYSLIPDEAKQSTHLKIGRLLLSNTPDDEKEERIFDIVNHLNIGVELIVDRTERNQLASLNLMAGRKAKTSTAYAAAVDYLTIGRNLLADDSWTNLYDLTIDIYVEAVEAEYLNTNFDLSHQLAEIVLRRAHNLLDQFRVYEAQIQSYIAQNQMKSAVDTGLQVLGMLGVSLETELPATVEISALANLPQINNPYKIAALRILCAIASATYLASPELYPAVVFTMAHICSKYGNSAPASYAYACCSLICEVIGEIELGCQYGQLSLQVLDKFPSQEFHSKVLMVYNACVRHWKEPSRSSIASLVSAVQSGLETGDIEYACYSAMYLCIYSFFSGENLRSVDTKYEQYIELMLNYKQEYQTYYTKIWRQLTLNLQGLAEDNCRLVGESFNEDEMLPVLLAANNVSSLFGVYFAKLVVNYLFGERDRAVENAQLAQQYVAGVGSLMMVPQYNFYHSLALVALYPHADSIAQEQYLNQVAANQEKMQTWAFHAPMNYQHKYDLVAAEIARVLGHRLEAMDLYDRAIATAKENQYLQEEALAGELAAKFYLELGKYKIARVYLTDAYYAYARWGSPAKIHDLEQKYPQLLYQVLEQKTSLYAADTIDQTLVEPLTSTGNNIGTMLDLATVIKASQAISGEINVEELLSTLIGILTQNAGASKGSLILERAGQLSIVAKCLDERCYLPNIPLSQSQNLPITAINYVWRTRETLVINDIATENIFAADPYIIQHQPKSVLCTPIVNQGKAIGILYLENSLAPGAFTPDRLEVLKILSSQAAISLENALLYQTLEDKVEERTAQLAQANQAISALNQRLKNENLRMSAELDILKQMQQLILPKPAELAAIAELDIAGFMEPADEVGGDYYDVLCTDGVVTLCIGDVTGHGLESGILMVMTQAAVRALKEVQEIEPVRFLDTLNRTIYKNIQRMNSDKNMTLALLNYADSTISISGQHEETIVVRKGGQIQRIDTINLGFPIGLDEDISGWISHVLVDLEPGDGVVLYTDGIPEARNMHKKFYGIERLCEVVSQNWHLSAEQIKEATIDDLRKFIGQQKVFDDITLLVLKQQGNIVHNL
ncbi:AAA family ATPase [Microcoleus vaginatus]|uniref:AAA family ATPase n=1 Tax=Microcoleus vaginatus TaxID=119532 RepID=UPI0016859498|nr:AAA family ATPase [Microcoleus sp. FACHB-84]MBD2007360.1 AAA family ATPase [Microcoleus sp. FACHB-45]